MQIKDPQELGTIQIRITAIGIVELNNNIYYTASDILQTTPTTMTNQNIGYLTSSGISNRKFL